MPAEAVHLSALADTIARLPAPVARALDGDAARVRAHRAGVLLVDLPYFHAFHFGLLRYLVSRPQASSTWGDRLHARAPIAVGRRLAQRGAELRRHRATTATGHELIALALGYISHAAVDTALHPLVNRLAAARTDEGGPELLRQHQEVEKYQSILLHEERHGHDFMGTRELAGYISVDWSALTDDQALARSAWGAVGEVLDATPSPSEIASWTRGYGLFVRVISSPLGKRVAPREAKVRERPALFDAVDFHRRFALAVERSVRWVEALHSFVEDGRFDASATAALDAISPEQTLDPGPEAPPPA